MPRPSSFSSLILNSSTLSASGNALAINGNILALHHANLGIIANNTSSTLNLNNVTLNVNILAANSISAATLSIDETIIAGDTIEATGGLIGTLMNSDTLNISETQQTLGIFDNVIGWNVALGGYGKITLSDDVLVDPATNYRNGGRYIMEVIQNGSGGWSLTWDAFYVWENGSTPALTGTASRREIFVFYCSNNKFYGKKYGEYV